MRSSVLGLPVALPLGSLLPSIYQSDDEFIMRFMSGLDEVLAPVLSTLDCLTSYVDPRLAPADFLDWLANWVGLEITFGDTDLARMRLAVAEAVRLYRLRGTPAGLREHLELITGGLVEIADSGGVVASGTPDTPLPGEDTPRLAIRVTGASDALAPLVDAVVRASKPAHVRHVVEVV
ncbi:MAG TPA: phage tail protein [Pseudonocardiaceae bacterium]|jgi:phage tail-like protein